MNKNWYYTRNDYLLNHWTNVTFEQILAMSEDEFKYWCIDLRKAVVYSWDELGIPPRVGYNEDAIIEQFQQMDSFPVNKFLVKNELTKEKDVIRNTHILGNAVNQWFPTMMKVRINYTEDDKGRSIYDFFAQDDLLDRFITYSKRHFKRDSFYHYSRAIEYLDTKTYGKDLPIPHDGVCWIEAFEQDEYRKRGKYDYWLAPIKEDGDYTGYNEQLKGKQYLTLKRYDIEYFCDGLIPDHCKTNVDFDKSELYQIRVYELGQKLFPIGFKNWKVSFNQYAVNYPPLIAKYIYERYTEQYKKEDNIIVWDPSAGWAGRLLGALSVKLDRHIIYLANDPNTDHNTENDRTKYHEIYDFYCKNVEKGGLWTLPHNEFKFWQLGSEVMQHDPEFQQYKGMLSLVFTSPPYFNREAYSEDDAQSYKKFTSYDVWKNEFLYETLKTAYDWLRPGGHIVWNIADLKIGNKYLPLEQDSKDIMESLGMTYIETLKMALGSMPGANRTNEDGTATAKNFCKVNGQIVKYEPVIVFRK